MDANNVTSLQWSVEPHGFFCLFSLYSALAFQTGKLVLFENFYDFLKVWDMITKVSSLASVEIQLDRLTRALSCCFSHHPVMQHRASPALYVRARPFSWRFFFLYWQPEFHRLQLVFCTLSHLCAALRRDCFWLFCVKHTNSASTNEEFLLPRANAVVKQCLYVLW